MKKITQHRKVLIITNELTDQKLESIKNNYELYEDTAILVPNENKYETIIYEEEESELEIETVGDHSPLNTRYIHSQVDELQYDVKKEFPVKYPKHSIADYTAEKLSRKYHSIVIEDGCIPDITLVLLVINSISDVYRRWDFPTIHILFREKRRWVCQ